LSCCLHPRSSLLKMLTLGSAAFSFTSAPLTAPRTARTVAPKMETKADLEVLAKELNPTLGFWDPLALSDSASMSAGGFLDETAAVGFLRHAEIKHGRVAMAAFVGFCVQSNGIHFPWDLTLTDHISYASISEAGGPAAQWDALPTASKLQIFGAIGFLEGWGENSKALGAQGQKHYMKGGKAGYFPSFQETTGSKPAIHPIPLDLWDPFGFTKKMTPERKAKALKAEINNGRLAMIGIFGLISASKGLIVPGLDGLGIAPYAGEYMAPFAAGDASLPFVPDMLKYTLSL